MMKNGKNIALILTGVVLGTTLTGGAVAAGLVAEPTWNPIFVDGVQVEMEAYRIGGNNYVKLRDIGEKVGFNVFWDDGVQIESDAPYTGVKPEEVVPESTATATQQQEKVDKEEPADTQEIRNEMVERINEVRRKHGVGELTVNQSLMDAAQDCSGRLYTSHNNRVECETVIAYGYPHGFGANLTVFTNAYRSTIAERAVTNWEKSPGHLQTMLDPRADTLGVGVTLDNGRAFCYMFVGRPYAHNPYE